MPDKAGPTLRFVTFLTGKKTHPQGIFYVYIISYLPIITNRIEFASKTKFKEKIT